MENVHGGNRHEKPLSAQLLEQKRVHDLGGDDMPPDPDDLASQVILAGMYLPYDVFLDLLDPKERPIG